MNLGKCGTLDDEGYGAGFECPEFTGLLFGDHSGSGNMHACGKGWGSCLGTGDRAGNSFAVNDCSGNGFGFTVGSGDLAGGGP